MNWLCFIFAIVAQALALVSPGEKQSTAPVQPRFKCELYDAKGGALFKSRGGHFDCNDSVKTVFVDSKGWVWVGTVTGLAVYDGNQWTNRTLKPSDASMVGRVINGMLRVSDSGPRHVVEGPPGTIWLGGDCGLWRYRGGRYEEVNVRSVGDIVAMAVDLQGALWVVTKYNVQRYDGKTWTIVLCPYARYIHYELQGLRAIAIGTNGHCLDWRHDVPRATGAVDA